MKTVDGRDAITRKEVASRVQRSEAEVRRLYDARDKHGHPESAFAVGRTLYWWQDEIDAWWTAREERIRPKPIERVGDPDELLYAQQVADMLGYTDSRSVLNMLRDGQFSRPDAMAPAGRGGKPRPQWKRSTIWEQADKRGWVRK